MIEKPIIEKYFLILKSHVTNPEEVQLSESAELGRELVKVNVPPEEIAELHEEALRRLAEELPDMTLLESACLISEPLMELLMSYGMAYREWLAKRKQAEETLIESEEKYRGLFHNSTDFVYTLDLEGSFTDVNLTAELLTGYSKTELIGINYKEYIPPEHCKIVFEAFNKVYDTGEPLRDFPIEVILKDGTKRYFETNISLLIKEGRAIGFQGSSRDITERKKAEEALQELSKEQQIIFDSVPAAIWYKDTENRILRVNRAGAESVGMHCDDIIGKTAWELFPDEADHYYKDDKEVMKSGKPKLGIVERLQTSSGKKLWVQTDKVPFRDEQGTITGIIVFAADITEQKKAEEEIKYRYRLEEALSRVSRLFVSQKETDYNEVLSILGKTVSADRSYIFHFRENGSKMDNTYEWCAPGTEPQIDNLQDIDTNIFPWWMDKLNRNENIVIQNVGELPPEAAAEKEILQAQDIRSLFVVPIASKEKALLGFMGFDDTEKYREWHEHDAKILRIVSEMISSYVERRKVEEELIENFSLLKSTMDSTDDGILVIDRKGKVSLYNEQFLELWRIPKELADKKDDKKLLDYVIDQLKDPAAFLDKVKNLYAHPDKKSYDTLYFKDGRIFERYSQPQFIENEIAGRVWNFRNVTEKKEAEEELRESEELYRSFMKQSVEAIYTYDPQAKRVLEANDAFFDLLGYTADEIQSISLYDIVAHDKKSIDKKLKEVITKGTAILGERKWRHKNGTLIDVYITGSKIHLKGKDTLFFVARDITEHKKAEESLRKSEQKYRTITENLNVGIYRDTHGPVGKFLEVNPAMFKMFGYDNKEEFLALNVSDIYQNPAERALFSEKISKSGSVKNEEVHYKRKDGTQFLASDTAIAVKNENGEILYFDGIIEDITERKKMEQMLIQSEKLASLGTIAAGVAHEINNPIGYIYSNINTMKKYSEKIINFETDVHSLIKEFSRADSHEKNTSLTAYDELKEKENMDYIFSDMRDALSESLEGVEKVKRIVQDLREFSRLDKPESKLSDINDGIKKTLNILRNELKYKAEVIEEYGDVPEIECDIQKLNQVFLNVIINAVQAIEKRGVIRIKTFCSDNSVVIQISDTGKGIQQKDIRKIFDAFYTTKESGKGTGLGLSISQKIIQEHNGTIDVESEIGRGTVFTIKLPVSRLDQVIEYKILIVDDDKSIREVYKQFILKYDPSITVITAKDGFEAGDMLNTFKPDVVLLDIGMPGMNGFEVCTKIKTTDNLRNTKVIMITGLLGTSIKEKSIKAGADDLLTKPVSFNTFRKILDQIRSC